MPKTWRIWVRATVSIPKDWLDFWIDNDIPIVPMSEVVEKGIEPCTRFILDRAWNGARRLSTFSWDTDSLDCQLHAGNQLSGVLRHQGARGHSGGTYPGRVRRRCSGTGGTLAPVFDASQMSTKLACNLIYHYLGSRAATLRDRGRHAVISALHPTRPDKGNEDEPCKGFRPPVFTAWRR